MRSCGEATGAPGRICGVRQVAPAEGQYGAPTDAETALTLANTAAGGAAVNGPVIQARDIQGGINLG